MNKRGFTLIEAVMVIVVIGLASAGLAAVVFQSLHDSNRPPVIATATGLAAKEAERVIRLSFAAVADENRGTPLSYSGDFDNYAWEVRVDSIDDMQPNLGTDPAMEDYKCVEVRVHHSVIGSASLKFLKTNH